MPVLSRYRISSFQDVQIDQPAGLVNDGQFSTYTLDDPAITPGGTGDFLGVIKTSVLLGRLVREEIDTRRYTIADLNNLTINQYQEEIANGNIIQNPRSRTNSAEEIGWVELGRSRASFYYKDCTINGNRGKQPTAEFFYTLGTFNLDGKILRGINDPQGRAVYFGAPALEQIGAYNQVDVLNNFGLLGPNFAPMDINEYMSHALAYKTVQLPTATGFRNSTGWYFPNGTGDFLATTGYRTEQLSNIQLLLATKSEHFDNELTQPYSSGVWARSRETAQGVRVSGNLDFRTVDRFSGLCLPLGEIVIPDDGGDGGEDEEEKWYGGGDTIDEDIINDDDFSDNELEDEVNKEEDGVSGIPDFTCDRESTFLLKMNYYPYDDISKLESSGSHISFGAESLIPSGTIQYSSLSNDENDVLVLDLIKDEFLHSSGVVDPRDFSGNSFTLPRGAIKGVHNIKKCTIDVFRSFRDKDGDRPEIIGPIVTKYMEDLRISMMQVFGTPNPLKMIGYGSDGYEYYSDGNSYTELHGESVFGCGKPFTIAEVPEIFTEMYPVKVDNSFYGKYGKDENDFVKHYRTVIERPSDFPAWMSTAMDWLITMPAKFTDSRMRVSDLFNDLVLGIPDMDMSIVGSRNDDNILSVVFNNLLHEVSSDFSALGRLVSDSKLYMETGKQLTAKEILDRYNKLKENIVLNAVNPFAKDLSSEEKEELYRYIEIFPYMFSSRDEVDSMKNNLPKRISRYKKFDNLWGKSYLNLVYAKNDEQLAQLIGRDVDYILKVKKANELSTKFYNRTTDELLYLKSKLSIPSRWKAMTRPIYQNLWYDKEMIQPYVVATEPYVMGTSIFELELGDYDNHRSKFGAVKNLYDTIDDIISLKIDENVFEDYGLTLVGETYSMLADIQSVFNMIASPNISKNLNNILNKFFIAWEDLKALSTNRPNDLGSYTRFAEDVLRSYTSVASTINEIKNILNKGVLPEGVVGPEGPGATVQDFLNNTNLGDVANYLKEKAVHALQITLTNALNWAQQEFNRVYPDRSSFSPRRVFKSGNVYLESKSGVFSTNKQPCPIIFLGFNDGVLASSFDSFNATNGCVDFLYKNDKISSIRYMRELDYVNPTDTDLVSLGGTNLGNLPLNGNTDGARMRYGKIEDIPTINRRFRQYGRNPLLDIFYLNMVPESVLGAATPEPFRYPRVELQKQQLRNKKVVYSYVPSIFPPHWNEPIVNDGPPKEGEKDNSMFLHGDLQDFHNRRRNNILTAPDRWEMRTDVVGNASVVVLKDKTRILDIYYGLMRMHVLGFGWAEIREYANQARKAVKIKSLSKKSITSPTGTSIQLSMGSNEEESTIDLNALELLWDKISARLSGETPLHISTPEVWFTPTLNNINDISKAVSSNDRGMFYKNIKIYNNTQSEVKIKSIEIVSDNESDYDNFGQNSNNLFYYSTSGTKTDPEPPIIQISRSENLGGSFDVSRGVFSNDVFITDNTTDFIPFLLPTGSVDAGGYYEFSVWFIPYGAQNSYTYTANLRITSEWGGDEYINTRKLVGRSYTEQISFESQGYTEPLELPNHLIFGSIKDLDRYDDLAGAMQIRYFNKSNEEVIIESFVIDDEKIIDLNGEEITDTIVSSVKTPSFFLFENNSTYSQDPTEFPPEKYFITRIVTPGKTRVIQSIDYDEGPTIKINKSGMLMDDTYRANMIYTGRLTINYSLNPRLNSSDRIKKVSTCVLVFNTRET